MSEQHTSKDYAMIKQASGGANASDRARLAHSITHVLKKAALSEYFVLLLTVVLFLVLLPFIPTLGVPENLSNLLSNYWPLLVIAIGQTFVMIIGGIDLSQIAIVAVTSVLGAALITLNADPVLFEKSFLWGTVMTEQGGLLAGHPLAVPLAAAAMVATGAAIGAFTGAIIAYFNIPAFMMTLVMLLFFSAFAVFLTRSENVTNLPDAYGAIADRGLYGFLSTSMLIALLVAAAAHVVLSQTVFGRWIYATGTNLRAAVISGVPTKRVIILVYAISGACAAIGSILYSSRLDMGRPAFGDNLELLLDIVGATVIGGTSLFGGRGKVIWTVFGVLLFVLMSNALNLLNLSFFMVSIVKGCVILAAALLDVKRRQVLAR